MRKAIIKVLLLLGILSFSLAGCQTKGIEPSETAEIYLNKMIYNKDKEKFAKNFENSHKQEKELKNISENFSASFLEGMKQSGGEISSERSEEISKKLWGKIKNETSFKVKTVKKTDSGAQVTYLVYGLDLVSIMKNTTQATLDEALKDQAKYAQAEVATLLDMAIENFEQAIDNGKSVKKATEITLNFTLNHGKWSVSKKDQEKFNDIAFAFLTGQDKQSTFQEKSNAAMEEVTQETLKKTQNSSNQTPTSQ